MIRTDGRPTIAWSDGPADPKRVAGRVENHIVIPRAPVTAQPAAAEAPAAETPVAVAGELTTYSKED